MTVSITYRDDRNSAQATSFADKCKQLCLGVSALALIAVPATLATTSKANAQSQGELVQLLKEQSAELKRLKKEVDELKKKSSAPQRSSAPAKASGGGGLVTKGDSFDDNLLDRFVEKGRRPKSWRIPGTDADISFNGFAKLDFIERLFGETTGADLAFTTNAITVGLPGQGQPRGADPRSILHARESRFGVEVTKPSDFGLIRARLELDLFNNFGTELVSNSAVLRLRHAYGEIGPLLAGQFWGTFGDPSTIAETLDFQGTPGYTFIRQAQIRYTHEFSKGVTLAFAVENPEARIVVNGNGTAAGGLGGTGPGGLVNGVTSVLTPRDNNIPDFVVRGRIEDSWGSLQLGVLFRSITGENFAGTPTALVPTAFTQSIAAGTGRGTDFGVAGSVHGKINLPGSGSATRTDFIAFQVLGGQGLGRYLQDAAGASGEATLNPITGRLELLTSYGGYITYQHSFLDNLRGNLSYSQYVIDTPAFLNGTALKGGQYVAGNLIWTPVRDVDLGIEIQWAERENVNRQKGDALRLQTSAIFRF